VQSFRESSFGANHHPPFHLHDPVVSTRLDNLAINTGGPKHLPDDSFIELESIRGDQRNILLVRSFRYIPKQSQRVFVTSSANDSRRPKSGPYLDGCEDPGRCLLTFDDRSDLVGLKFRDLKSGCFFIVEATAAVAGSFQPAVDRIPTDALDARDSRFVQTFDAETANLIKGSAPVLKSIVRSPDIRSEGLLA